MSKEADAWFFIKLDTNGFGAGGDLVCLPDRWVRLEESQAVFEIDFEGILPGKIFRAGHSDHLCGPEWLFEI